MCIKLHGYRLILKMHSLSVLIALILTVVNGMKPSMAKSVNNQINNPSNGRQCNEAPVNDCNCHCNLHQDSSLKYAIEALETKMEHLIALVNKTSIPKSSSSAAEISSCKEQYERDNSSKSQMYALKFGFQEVPVYCHMGDFGCGNGGWTLTMKIDGTKGTFRYDSPFWSDRNVHNLAGGKTGFDHQETKLPSYWSTPFSKICLGMKIGHQNKFITINKDANSLFSLIADGSYLATSIGRNTWKELIGSQASLQQFCNKEGFNAKCTDSSRSKARIGIVTNNEKKCHSCDSRIGFGTGGHPDDWNTCGNEAVTFPDNGNAHIKTMGYILVQ